VHLLWRLPYCQSKKQNFLHEAVIHCVKAQLSLLLYGNQNARSHLLLWMLHCQWPTLSAMSVPMGGGAPAQKQIKSGTSAESSNWLEIPVES